ncbi:MAG: hypothetical protein HY921_05840 [Elusimicrobia bacterium]|nr:hypothetical protein [Elusimicrobiota bacterium]
MSATTAAQVIDDSDLSRPLEVQALESLDREARQEPEALVFSLSPARFSWRPLKTELLVNGRLALQDRDGRDRPARLAQVRLVGSGTAGAWIPADAQGGFSLSARGLSGTYRLRFKLDNPYWRFNDPRQNRGYEWESPPFELSPGAGADLGTLKPEAGSQSAQLGLLHLTYLEALAFLEKNASTTWWRKPLTLNWPSRSDFFSPWAWSLDLSSAAAWDVVLHELGHAVMHGAMRADPAGGQHKIDECYSQALAWSEGWATFFAAAVRLSPEDPDAKFEFLVPRRAPIRIENVPEDVCAGPSNEWRVAAGLWDLLDAHPDGKDAFSMGFSRLWNALEGQSMGSMDSAWSLIQKNLDPTERQAGERSLIQNTLR